VAVRKGGDIVAVVRSADYSRCPPDADQVCVLAILFPTRLSAPKISLNRFALFCCSNVQGELKVAALPDRNLR
jgi:hypothetical protein